MLSGLPNEGWLANRAATPDTCAAAMEVPENWA
jgi:hypothetical protein